MALDQMRDPNISGREVIHYSLFNFHFYFCFHLARWHHVKNSTSLIGKQINEFGLYSAKTIKKIHLLPREIFNQ